MKNGGSILVSRQNMGQGSTALKCRLLYLVGQLRLGGLERQLSYLVANVNQTQYRPAVVVWNLDVREKYYKQIQALKIPIYGFAPESSPLSKLRAFRYLTQQIAPEVVHSYGYHTNFAAHYAARAVRALPIGSLRSDFAYAKAEGGRFRSALNARWPSCLIANSMAAADAVRRHSGVFAPRRVFVVRNGLDLNQFSCSDETSAMRKYIAAVGSLFHVKRWDRLLKAVKKMKNLGAENVRVRIAGDGPLRPALEKLAENLGISEVVEFQGAIQDVPTFLRRAKFLVHTSESEGCPNSVMEAMACGIPVVAMEAGDIPSLVEEGKTGFIVRQGDETAFVERIFQLLGDDELCHWMGLMARKKAEREFGLERLVEDTLAAYMSAGWQG
jgi:L-malate glycosyltransferase